MSLINKQHLTSALNASKISAQDPADKENPVDSNPYYRLEPAESSQNLVLDDSLTYPNEQP